MSNSNIDAYLKLVMLYNSKSDVRLIWRRVCHLFSIEKCEKMNEGFLGVHSTCGGI